MLNFVPRTAPEATCHLKFTLFSTHQATLSIIISFGVLIIIVYYALVGETDVCVGVRRICWPVVIIRKELSLKAPPPHCR